MTDHSKLEKYEDNWQTSMGGMCGDGKVLLRGENIFTELNDKRLDGVSAIWSDRKKRL